MLEQKDYQTIKQLFREENEKLFTKEEGIKLENNLVIKIGEVIEDNILPAIEEIIDRKLDIKLNNLPDKGYLSDKLADLEGVIGIRQRKENKRVNLLIEFLKNKKIISDDEFGMLQEIQVFPVMPTTIEEFKKT